MGDLSGILVALCGFGVVCLGTLLLGGFVFLRFGGRNLIFPMISGLTSVLNLDGGENAEQEEDPDDIARRVENRPLTQDRLQERLRRADEDFANALNRQRSGEGDASQQQSPELTDYHPHGANRPLPGSDRQSDSSDYPRDRRGRRRREYDDGEEVFGGGLDNDADGIPDIFE